MATAILLRMNGLVEKLDLFRPIFGESEFFTRNFSPDELDLRPVAGTRTVGPNEDIGIRLRDLDRFRRQRLPKLGQN